MHYSGEVENLDSARSLPSKILANPNGSQQGCRKDLTALRPFRARPVDLDSRWSVDFHTSASRPREGHVSLYASVDNVFGSAAGGAWSSGLKAPRDAVKGPPATAIKLTYFSMKEGRANNDDAKNVAMSKWQLNKLSQKHAEESWSEMGV